MKVDLSKFKLKSKDGKIATLVHPEGHEFRVAINALHPENRKNLDALELHERHDKPKMAKGGKVEAEPIDPPEPKEHVDYEEVKETVISNGKKLKAEPIKMADGGDVADVPEAVTPFGAPDPMPMAPMDPNSPAAGSAEPQDPQLAQMSAQLSQLQAQPGGEQPLPAAPEAQIPPSGAKEGYENQVRGAANEAAAIQEKADSDEKALIAQASAQQKLASTFNSHIKDLNEQREAVRQDIKDQHIDYNRYLANQDTGQRIMTGISLFLGGLGGGGTSNVGLDFLNKQIDRDIGQQRAELDKKQSLYSMLREQGHDDAAATDMARVIMQDQTANQLALSAARSNSPLAKARATDAIGKLQSANDGLIQQQAVRNTLRNGANGGLQNQDPSQFVQFVVPKERQAEVYKEIERAQDTRANAPAILMSFDKAAQDINGFVNRPLALIKEPRSAQALHVGLGPTFKDVEGTVRQAAMDNVFKSVTPVPGDTAADIKTKRAALEHYITAKSSAPVAKGNGIDLDKFKSTSNNAEIHLTPQQQSFVKFARENPQDPRSAQILKKLNLK